MTEPDPLADVFDDTSDAPLPEVMRCGGGWTVQMWPAADDPRWTPTEEAP